jgi:hypothetical protein
MAWRTTTDPNLIETVLEDDESDRIIEVGVRCVPTGIEIIAEGYGENEGIPGQGAVVYLDWFDGKLKVHVYQDINNQEPTTISLEGARESLRKES